MTEGAKQISNREFNRSVRENLSLDRFRLLHKFEAGRLNCGPLYHTYTSHGEPVDVHVLYWDKMFSNGLLRNLFLLGSNGQSGIVARKSPTIDYRKEIPIAGGTLEAAYKGYGFGTPMELVFADILQREANRTGLITWVFKI